MIFIKFAFYFYYIITWYQQEITSFMSFLVYAIFLSYSSYPTNVPITHCTCKTF